MDRERIVSTQAQDDNRSFLRRSVERVIGSAVVIGGAALKWGFLFTKFGAFFISFALYSALFHSWQVGLGLVLLILVHEMGHFVEAKRQGVRVTLPMFVPFFGAYVLVQREGVTPWRGSLISLAGPFVGSLGAAAAWIASGYGDTQVLLGIASLGFLLNAFNLLPIGFLDGGAVSREIGKARRGWIRTENGVPVEAIPPDPAVAWRIAMLYGALAAAIVLALFASKPGGAI
jgi:membrane-associated protease RseP (regulator of RpoE activity)